MAAEASNTEERFSWLDLPAEILELIISNLPFSDRPYFASVCKSWSDIMHTSFPPIYPVGKGPLLLHSKTLDKGIFKYYSPLLNKTFQVQSPFDFTGYEFLYAKDGFLLIYNDVEMKMVNPFSGDSFTLSEINGSLPFDGVAIGVQSGYYIYFFLEAFASNILIEIHDNLGWEMVSSFDNDKPFCLAPSSNPVYCDDRFYCLSTEGSLGVFDLLDFSWSIADVEFKKFDRDCVNETYLVESNGTVIAVQIENYGTGVHIFSLDREKMIWEEMYDLGDRCLFVGSKMSLMPVPMEKELRNTVFVPRFQEEPETIVAEVNSSDGRLYFVSKSQMSSRENCNTGISCYNLANGDKSDYFGSSEMIYSIWFEASFTVAKPFLSF